MHKYERSKEPGAKIEGNPNIIMGGPQEIELDGKPFHLASSLCCGRLEGGDDLSTTVLVVEGVTHGFFVRFTPMGARLFAQRLIDAADRAERDMAEDVAARLAAATKRGGRR